MTFIDEQILFEQRKAIQQYDRHIHHDVQPVEDPIPVPSSHPSPLLHRRQVGCVVMAGGQATRLGATVPKGIIPFAPVSGKSLLQLIVEKVMAHSRYYQIRPHIAIMTSETTDKATRTFFSDHKQIDFFIQPSLPLLDTEKHPIIDMNGKVLMGPDGNGSLFRALVASGILTRWESEGVEALSIIMVDNPLFDPLSPALLTPVLEGVDLTAAAIERTDPQEQVGLFVREAGQIRVVEYSELDVQLQKQRDETGRLLFRWANISAFGCSPSFVRASALLHLPLHVAKKTVAGKSVWKAEYFVFDALPAAKSIQLVSFNRKESFAPVKDKSSFEAAQKALKDC